MNFYLEKCRKGSDQNFRTKAILREAANTG